MNKGLTVSILPATDELRTPNAEPEEVFEEEAFTFTMLDSKRKFCI
jgi:hypothetical protein